MPGQDLTTKLLLKPGMSVLAIDPPTSYEEIVGGLPEGARVVGANGTPADFVHVFATGAQQLKERLPGAIAALREDGLLWIAYPRVASTGTREISRDAVHEALTANGWRPVTQVSMDDTWTAIRGRPLPR